MATLVPALMSLLIAPFSHNHGPTYAAFLPMFIGAIVVINVITAYLLYRQYVDGVSPALIVLTCAYLFEGAIAVAYILGFPGMFGMTGALGATSQTSAYLWVAWHAAFPAFAIAYVFLDERCAGHAPPGQACRRLAGASFAFTAIAVVIVAVVCFRFSGFLPVLIVNGAFHVMNRMGLGPAIVSINAAALALLWFRTRGRTVIHLWLVVAIVATILDAITTLTTGKRYDIGWYASRLNSSFASLAVLVALLNEAGRLSHMIARAERQLRAVVDGVGDVLVAVGEHGDITWFNPAASALFGYTSAEAARQKIDELFVDPSPAGPAGGTNATLARHRSGRTFAFEYAFGGSLEGNIAAIMIGRDITQRKNAETTIARARDQALQAARMKASFLATMSHEIRTPINAVMGMSELLADSSLASEQHEYAMTIRDSAGALLTIVNDILDFSKLEAGKVDLESVAFNPRGTVEAAAEMLAAQARQKGLTLLTHVAPDVPVAVLGDASRLRQVLVNLIGNAVKFTAVGSVVVRAFVDHTVGEESLLRFTITDTGIGLSPEARERLFSPFVQADASTNRRFGGTGLGLSISKALCEAMGGEVGIDSVEGAGSTFWFTVCLTRVSDTPSDERLSTLRGLRCLIVGGDNVTRQIMRQYLFSWGMIGTVADDALHAETILHGAIARGARYDLVIVDGEAGEPLVFGRRVHALDELRGTKLLLVTAYNEVGVFAEAYANGYTATLRKPLRQSSLFNAIAEATERALKVPDSFDHRAALPIRDDAPILIVEDNAVNQRVALQQLKKLGYRARAVGDGRAAVEAAATEPFALTLMDCQMPDVDGFEATRLIRIAEADGSTRVPIVAMTAGALEGDREQCLAAGMDDYLAKPVLLGTLQAIIDRWIPREETAVAH